MKKPLSRIHSIQDHFKKVVAENPTISSDVAMKIAIENQQQQIFKTTIELKKFHYLYSSLTGDEIILLLERNEG